MNSSHSSLTTETYAQCWTLDETGNWSAFQQADDGSAWSLKQSRAANPVNEIETITSTLGDAWANPNYDRNGNMNFIPRPESPSPSWATLSVDQWSALTVDEWAGLQVAGAFEAKYDAWNRLVKVSDPKGTVQENEYDGRGYRTVTKTYEEGVLSETRYIYYTDQWQAVEERLGSEATADRQFVWGVRYLDDLVLRDSSVSSTLDQRLYALQDANWNVTAVVNDAGSVQERYEYDPYGNTTVLTSTFAEREESAFDWETTYCGYRYDAATNLYSVRHRFYSAKIGNWLTRDPIGYADGNNLYRAYFVPNGTDPSGLADWVWPWDSRASWNPATTASLWGGATGNFCKGYSHYLTNPSRMDSDLQIGSNVAGGVRDFAVGAVAEPYDWYLTGQEIYGDPWSPWSYAGALPIVPATAGKIGKKAFGAIDEAVDAAKAAGKCPNPDGSLGGVPHRKKIRALADDIEATGRGKVIAGGGREKEQLIKTPGGYKEGRRTDAIYETPNGSVRGVNVGKSTSGGQPISRERKALDDLDNRGNLHRFCALLRYLTWQIY